jgi:hypothetical protein
MDIVALWQDFLTVRLPVVIVIPLMLHSNSDEWQLNMLVYIRLQPINGASTVTQCMAASRIPDSEALLGTNAGYSVSSFKLTTWNEVQGQNTLYHLVLHSSTETNLSRSTRRPKHVVVLGSGPVPSPPAPLTLSLPYFIPALLQFCAQLPFPIWPTSLGHCKRAHILNPTTLTTSLQRTAHVTRAGNTYTFSHTVNAGNAVY